VHSGLTPEEPHVYGRSIRPTGLHRDIRAAGLRLGVAQRSLDVRSWTHAEEGPETELSAPGPRAVTHRISHSRCEFPVEDRRTCSNTHTTNGHTSEINWGRRNHTGSGRQLSLFSRRSAQPERGADVGERLRQSNGVRRRRRGNKGNSRLYTVRPCLSVHARPGRIHRGYTRSLRGAMLTPRLRCPSSLACRGNPCVSLTRMVPAGEKVSRLNFLGCRSRCFSSVLGMKYRDRMHRRRPKRSDTPSTIVFYISRASLGLTRDKWTCEGKPESKRAAWSVCPLAVRHVQKSFCGRPEKFG